MKAFIIHIKGNETSEHTAHLCHQSCLDQGYEPELFEGITPDTVDEWDKKYNLTVLKPSHMYDRQIGKNGSKFAYLCKYSNFINHYTLWNKCVEMDEPIACLEHDVLAIKPYNCEFDELLVLNMHSGLHQEIFESILKPDLHEGVHTYENKFLLYRAENIWLYSGMIPGTGAYCISPKGARRLIDNVKKYGWDKADYIINTKSVHMEYVFPEYFMFSHHLVKNQRTSHGEM